jgi:hypothetical protein
LTPEAHAGFQTKSLKITRRQFLATTGRSLLTTILSHPCGATEEETADVCIYGGTASGVAAAMAAADEGARVVLVEPSRWLGGMSGGGTTAPHMDWGRKEASGGLALKLLIDGDDPGMRAQNRVELARRGVVVIYEHRVSAVRKEGGFIRSIALDFAPPDAFGVPAPRATTPAAKAISARVFVDCSYEGDLMAKAGVRYTFGRESREEYGESLGGMLPIILKYRIDPFVKPGDAKSGLIPLVQDYVPGPPGSADKLTQLYCFRLKLSKGAERISIEKPDDYDPRLFEIFRRGFQSKAQMDLGMQRTRVEERVATRCGLGPFHENASRSLWSQAAAGTNTEYPEGDWATRSRIWRFHIDFIRGFYHFLRTDPSVPQPLRERADSIGLRPGVYDDTRAWPNQLYIREAGRMKSAYVLTQKDVAGVTDVPDSIGLSSYGVDDWPYAAVPHEGGIGLLTGEFMNCRLNRNTKGIYKVPYRAITPRKENCENLLVPVCCSASHVAMCSLRMEPVYVVLGQSAGVAAALAAKGGKPVQELDYAELRARLQAAAQKLEVPA